MENGLYVTGLNHTMEPNNPQPICIVLEPFHDRDFENGVEFQYGHKQGDCFKLSKCITTTSRKYRGPADGWIRIEAMRTLTIATKHGTPDCCCEMMITSNTQPRARNELDIIVLK
eukprot:4871334-Amphidinium_carterae.1